MAKQTFTTGQVLTAAQVNSLQTNDFNQTVSVKTANYTLVAADKGTRIEFNTSGSVTCTVNSGLFDAGDTLVIQNRGAGTATVTAGTATVNTSASLVVKQYDSGVLYFVSDSSAIYFASDAADTPLTTKGDLFTFSTAADRLAVGNNGDTLVADSAASTGLRWQGSTAAGRNFAINGGFDIWQRGTSFTTSGSYTADRWYFTYGGTVTAAQETTVVQDGSTNSVKLTTGAATSFGELYYALEAAEVNFLAGKTITISGSVRASSAVAYTGSAVIGIQTNTTANTQTGGTWTEQSTSNQAPSTSAWTRFSLTYSVPSGTKGLRVRLGNTSTQASGTILYWSNIQIEVGSVATGFSRAGGTIQGELAACEYYYRRRSANATATAAIFMSGFATATTNIGAILPLGGAMRTAPSFTASGTIWARDGVTNLVPSASAIISAWTNTSVLGVNWTVTGATQYRPYVINSGDNSTAYIELSAEL